MRNWIARLWWIRKSIAHRVSGDVLARVFVSTEGNRDIASFLHCCLTTVDVLKKYRRYLFISESKQLYRVTLLLFSNQNPRVSFLIQ